MAPAGRSSIRDAGCGRRGPCSAPGASTSPATRATTTTSRTSARRSAPSTWPRSRSAPIRLARSPSRSPCRRKSPSRRGQVFELSPTILTVTGLDDGRIVEVNDAFLLATGYSRNEVIGRSVPEIAVWVDPAQREAGLAELRAGRSIRNVEARFRAKNGRDIVAIANADVVAIDGRPEPVTAATGRRDRVAAEAALRLSR